MICFSPKDNAFLLSGKHFSYAMYVNGAGFLQHLYYGKKLAPADIPVLIAAHGKASEPNLNDRDMDMYTSDMPSECGSFGRGDFRSATVIVGREDGAAMSSFRYVSHQIVKGALALPGMPCARRADESLIITLRDSCSDTQVDLNYSVSEDSDILVRSLTVRNVGKEKYAIKKAFSFCTDFPDACGTYSAMRLSGAWARERAPVSTPLAEGTLRIESIRGYSSHQMNPFLALLSEGCGEECGECYGFALLYSGSFAITAEVTHNRYIRVQGGINDYLFGW